ncbi:hypothetical protein [Clostridium weizhouense]|uniref:Uncharacterized protein n=1 Tax=Clostridium weizhouense TaxID=2859781 RepID=A0ABS7APD8_9CLOT|nr:hypothetical protein [Clostridium weizhouense]MBW6410528.1 hypothetical protein [Clostridium weizhouense]
MRYIGPFFRMNSLSQKEISSQLFYLSKESVKTIVLNSKCGLLMPIKISKKSSSTNDISILNNFSPLTCIYRKSSPMFIHSKSSHGFDESTFKKEIAPSTNALMTLCILELSDYYSNYCKDNRNVVSFEKAYNHIAKEQLKFYSKNLRNTEGLFVNKKNISDSNSKGFNLIDKDSKFKFSDQAFMMDAYYLYYFYNKSDPVGEDYKNFANEILDMFKNYKESLYELSFSENLNVLLSLNVFYKYSNNNIAKDLILDLSDFLINRFMMKDYFINSLEDCSLFAICLMESYKHTNIISFKEMSKEITNKLISLYDKDKNIFVKLNDKKDSKYSCLEINFYILSLLLYSQEENRHSELKPIISSIYRKFYVNGDLLTSWPEAPTLDEVERYRNLSLRSKDMLEESYFRMPNLPTPESSGLAPIFVKNLSYSKKRDSFSSPKVSFDSNKNMFSFFVMIYFLKDSVINEMGFIKQNISRDNSLEDNKDITSNSIDDSREVISMSKISDTEKTLTNEKDALIDDKNSNVKVSDNLNTKSNSKEKSHDKKN